MVFIQIPSQLTEEEKTLQQKYQKLKRKKKALQALKAPKPEPAPIQVQLKRAHEGGSKQDAKEVAKKLLKSGAISAIKVPVNKESQGQGFKRSKALERKRIGPDKPGGYQPFMSVHSQDSDTETGAGPAHELTSSGTSPTSSSPKTPTFKPQFNLYENFVSARDAESIAREETNRERRRDGKANYVNRDIPNQGNTVYVHGFGVEENLLRNGFSPYGNILNITVEEKKNCGFLTFETIDEANKAIAEMNNQTVDGVMLKVSLARKQPMILPPLGSEVTQAATTNSWSTIAASFSNKHVKGGGGHKDTRELVTYDDA